MNTYVKYDLETNKELDKIKVKDNIIQWYEINLSDFSKNLLRTWIGLKKE